MFEEATGGGNPSSWGRKGVGKLCAYSHSLWVELLVPPMPALRRQVFPLHPSVCIGKWGIHAELEGCWRVRGVISVKYMIHS